MSLAVDLHRGREYPTAHVVHWLKRRSWRLITMATGQQMASPPGDQLAVLPLMEAVLRQIVAETEGSEL